MQDSTIFVENSMVVEDGKEDVGLMTGCMRLIIL